VPCPLVIEIVYLAQPEGTFIHKVVDTTIAWTQAKHSLGSVWKGHGPLTLEGILVLFEAKILPVMLTQPKCQL